MKIAGFEKTALRDWEGRNACKVLISGCTFKCPYCNFKFIEKDSGDDIDPDEIFDYIKENKDFLDAAVISGGEPTDNADLYKFLKELKKLGLKIKLDTNGNNPNNLDDLIGAGMVDCVCLNIMAPLSSERYSKSAGTKVDVDNIRRSIEIIFDSGIENEFKTVITSDLTPEDIGSIAKDIKNAKSYIIQQFDPKNVSNTEYAQMKLSSNSELIKMANAAKKFVKNVKIRGV